MAGWEGAVAVGALCRLSAVVLLERRVSVLAFSAVLTQRLSAAVVGGVVPLASRAVSNHLVLLVDFARYVAHLEEPEPPDRLPEGHDPRGVSRLRVDPVSGQVGVCRASPGLVPGFG